MLLLLFFGFPMELKLLFHVFLLGSTFPVFSEVNSGPSYFFWVTMLIFTEPNILPQYIYQIIIQHFGLSIKIPIPQEVRLS